MSRSVAHPYRYLIWAAAGVAFAFVARRVTDRLGIPDAYGWVIEITVFVALVIGVLLATTVNLGAPRAQRFEGFGGRAAVDRRGGICLILFAVTTVVASWFM